MTIQQPTDKQLMQQLATGNEQAFDQLYARYKSSLYFYLKVRSSDALITSDIFQDTWETVFRSAKSYTDAGQFKAWLFSIARSRLIDYYRRQPNKAVHCNIEEGELEISAVTAPDVSSTETLADLFCQTDRLLSVMTCLPEAQQEALSLYVVGLSLTEIAEMTGVNKETAKSRVRYAKAKLIHQMQDSR